MPVETVISPGGPLWSEGVCGDQSYMNDADGYIMSPGYEHIQQPHYANNLKCEYRIQVEPGTRILFVMVALSLQRATPRILLSDCRNDYVQIFNGDGRYHQNEMYPVSYTQLYDNANSTGHKEAQHGQMCGSATTGQLQLWSTSNVATVRFSTDMSVTSTGFLLRWTTVYPKIDYELCGVRPPWRLRDNGASELNPQINKRIIGGQNAQWNTWPFACHYYAHNGTIGKTCGGTLIRNIDGAFFMITAGHCLIPPFHPRRISCASEGGPPYRRWGVQAFDVVNVTIHPEFSAETYLGMDGIANDIAVVELSRRWGNQDLRSIWYNGRAACLPNHRHNLIAHNINENDFLDRAIALGWGRISSTNRTTANTLQQVLVNILSDRYCNQVIDYAEGTSGNRAYLESEMCVYGKSGTRITNPICAGDSGGPLLTFRYDRDSSTTFDRKYRWTLTGVGARSSIPCGNNNVPPLYTDVFEYRGWINEQINGGG